MICVLTRVILSRNLDSWRQIINDPEDLLPIPVNEQEVSFGFDTRRVDGDGTVGRRLLPSSNIRETEFGKLHGFFQLSNGAQQSALRPGSQSTDDGRLAG